ncbi:uncharacterized protein [Watersipora subatra]|uniref:uncharacterized protein n=1 Tax=Watersipora subatra TaxID=2589382 RepID=UPI00355C3CF4
MSHCVGDLFDTSSNADRNIGDEIVEQGLAWSCPTDEVDSGTAVWRDVIPGEVVHGPHFLGHELDKIGQIADIEEILSDTQHIPLASEPSPAEFVTVRGPIISPHRKMKDPTNAYYRAQVCHKNEKGSYLAISLDYGQVREVTQSQLYQPCSGLLHILPSATLFSLRGLKPSPFSLNMLSTALSILQILTVGNFTICESMVNQWSALGVLTELASISPVESISSKSMTVLMHISKCSRVRCDEIVKRGTVSKTLELLKRFVGLNWRDAVLSTATALCSMLVDNSAASAQFECGVGALLAAISAYQSDEKVYSTLILCLRNHLGPIDVSLMIPKQTHVELQTSMPSDTSQLSSSVREPVVAISSPPSSLSTVEVKAISRFSRENEREVNASRHRQLDLNTLEQQESDNSSEKIVQPQLSLSNPACHREFYSLDEKTELRTGPNCSVYDSKASLDCLNVQKHIAGFLNAGVSGRLIFGVSSSGNAHGININRDTRDQLRLGMDRVCMELSPPLTANVPTLYFTPICCPEGAMDASLRTFIPDRFVVEIVVNASPAISQAYRVKPDDRLFLRMGSENKEANVQDFREMITRRLEEAVEAVV